MHDLIVRSFTEHEPLSYDIGKIGVNDVSALFCISSPN